MPTNTSDSTLDAISSITKKFYIPKLADEVNTSNALLMQMQKSGGFDTIDGGTDIRQPLRYARFAARGWYLGTQTLDTSYNEKKFSLIFPWAQYNVSITISGLDKIKNQGAAKVLDHVKTEVQAAQEDVKDAFGTGLYSDGSTNALSIIGTRGFLSTTATYGGVSQTSNSWLQAKIDTTTTALSLGQMQVRYEACKEGADAPTFITTTKSIYSTFWALLQPQQRFTDLDVAKTGFQNLVFNGAPVVVDSYAPTSSMNMLNLKHLKLFSSKERNFPGEFEDFQKPVNQDAMVAHIFWAGQLVADEVRKHGGFSAITS